MKQSPPLSALKEAIANAKKARNGWQSSRLISLLRQAAALDDVYALEDLGMLLRDGVRDRRGRRILARNVKESIRCYRRAAELGSVNAMDALATALSDGSHRRTRDVAEAIRWYRGAIARGGDSFNLAVTYQNLGQHEAAVRWFRKSRDVTALLELAMAELYGIGVRRNVSAALTKLRRVATAPSPDVVAPFHREEAMRIIADVLYHGWLVPRDYRGAVHWLRRAAKSGSDAARGLLRDLCEPER